MSGHNKWAQIKHKKAITDAKKGQLFSKLAKAITIAAGSNPDPKTNSQLKTAIDKARGFNMPNENTERAIKRVSDASTSQLKEIKLEIMGPGNVAIIASAITDNSNRTIAELRTVVSNHGGHIVKEGSLSWMFRRIGIITFRRQDFSPEQEESIMLNAIEAGADDVQKDDDALYITVAIETLKAVASAIPQLTGPFPIIEITLVPTSTVTPPEQDKSQLLRLLEALDDHNDVQDVITNSI